MFRGTFFNYLLVGSVGAFLGSCGPATNFEGSGPTRLARASGSPNGADAVVAPRVESHEEVFTTPLRDDEGVVISENDLVEHSFALSSQSSESEEKAKFVQVERKQISKAFSQGSVGAESLEEFSQSELGLIDILVVMDSSRSMGEEQLKVASRLPELISEINDANWQIRIVTTDPADSCARKLIKKSDMNARNIFKKTILDIGVVGSGDERGVQTAIAGLQCSEAWIRPNSNIAVLIVSDEDNCSNGDCSFEPIANNDPETLKRVLTSELGGSIRTLGEDARIYGLFKIPGDASCTTAYADAHAYRKLVVESKGVFGSICDDDYSTTLKQVSRDIRSQLKVAFSLSHIPDADSALILMDGTALVAGVDYLVNGQSVSFKVPPKPLAKITAIYRYGGSPLTQDFDLGEEVGQIEEIRLTKQGGQGEVVDARHYRVGDGRLIFDETPPEGAEIKVSFRQKEPQLINEFTIAKYAIPASVEAKINQQKVEVHYDPATGKLALAKMAQDRQNIEVSYKIVRFGAPVLRYQAKIDYSKLSELVAIDEESGESVNVIYDGKDFVIAPEHFREGRKIKLSYKVPGIANAHRQYKEASPEAPSFVVENNADGHADGEWRVFVNDQETKDYHREGQKLAFKSAVPPGSKIRVKVEHRGKH